MNDDIREIELTEIEEPENAMRSDIDRDPIFELWGDIKINGLINPITVRPHNGKFEVVAGHRRFLAHRYGGAVKIRCIVRELSDDATLAIMTSENLKREDVNPVDESSHVARLLILHNGDVGKVAEIVNRGRDWVESRATIALMPQDIKAALRAEKIKIGVAMALSQITDDVDRDTVLHMAISQGASVVMAQYFLAQWQAGLFGHTQSMTLPDANLPEGERQEVMLRDGLDGKDYPAKDFVTVLVYRENWHYIEGLRVYIRDSAAESATPPLAEQIVS